MPCYQPVLVTKHEYMLHTSSFFLETVSANEKQCDILKNELFHYLAERHSLTMHRKDRKRINKHCPLSQQWLSTTPWILLAALHMQRGFLSYLLQRQNPEHQQATGYPAEKHVRDNSCYRFLWARSIMSDGTEAFSGLSESRVGPLYSLLRCWWKKKARDHQTESFSTQTVARQKWISLCLSSPHHGKSLTSQASCAAGESILHHVYRLGAVL